MRWVVIAAGFLVGAGQATAQNLCSDVLRDGVYRQFSYQAGDVSVESLREWFFSDEFESYYRSGKSTFGFTIPFEGMPITLGGGDETEGAWDVRKQNEGSTEWDFRHVTWVRVLRQEEATAVLRAWGECQQEALATISGGISRIHLTPTTMDDAVSLEVKFEYCTGCPVPVILGFSATPGVQLAAATDSFTSTPIDDGKVFNFPWSEQGTEAVIVVKTQLGDERVHVIRPARGLAVVTYETEELGDWSFARVKAASVRSANNHNKRWNDKECDPPRGKWCATNHRATISVDPDEIIMGAQWIHASGPGAWHEHTMTYHNDARRVEGFLRAWTHPITYTLVAPVYKRTVMTRSHVTTAPIARGKLVVDVPAHATNVKIFATTALGVIQLDAGQEAAGAHLLAATSVGANRRFEYEIKPGLAIQAAQQ